LAKTSSLGVEQEREESLEWELASSGGLSVPEVDEIVVRDLEGGVVCGVG
jgi:hypothetical protein